MKIERPFWLGLVMGICGTGLVSTLTDHQSRNSSMTYSDALPSSGNGPVSSQVIQSGIAQEIRSSLALSVDGARYDANLLAADVTRLITEGFTRNESISTIRHLTSAGIQPSLMSDMSFSAGQIAQATSQSLISTSSKIADGVTRGYQACADLDDEFNFLTVEQRNQIRVDFDAGDADTARLSCFHALNSRAKLAAQAGS